MIKNEIIYGVIFLIISVIFFTLTYQFPDITIALSPKIFPRFVSICLFFLSLILLGQGIKKQLFDTKQHKVIQFNSSFVIRFIILVVITFFYLLIIDKIGYVIATPLFIAGTMIIFNEKKWYRIVLVSIITTILLYMLFRGIFRVPLPRFFLL